MVCRLERAGDVGVGRSLCSCKYAKTFTKCDLTLPMSLCTKSTWLQAKFGIKTGKVVGKSGMNVDEYVERKGKERKDSDIRLIHDCHPG